MHDELFLLVRFCIMIIDSLQTKESPGSFLSAIMVQVA